jgi:hypothetical protein
MLISPIRHSDACLRERARVLHSYPVSPPVLPSARSIRDTSAAASAIAVFNSGWCPTCSRRLCPRPPPQAAPASNLDLPLILHHRRAALGLGLHPEIHQGLRPLRWPPSHHERDGAALPHPLRDAHVGTSTVAGYGAEFVFGLPLLHSPSSHVRRPRPACLEAPHRAEARGGWRQSWVACMGGVGVRRAWGILCLA